MKSNSEPVVVSIPNTTVEKMESIKIVAQAVYELAKALNSVNVNVAVSNCVINNAKENGILIST